MKYLLDTNICIHFLTGKFGLIEKFEELGTENFAISEITLAELVFGAENSNNPKKNLELIEDFTNQIVILPIFNAAFLLMEGCDFGVTPILGTARVTSSDLMASIYGFPLPFIAERTQNQKK